MKSAFNRKKWTVLLLFGIIGQIAWSVENMYFNLFVFETIQPNLDSITLMVQLSGITATVVTLIAGTISDKIGNRRSFISIGYIIWGVSVLSFGFISPSLMQSIFGLDADAAVRVCLNAVIVGDCVMTLFGSTANDAAFSAWVTDNTEKEYRGRIESVISILPLIAMLIVAGGFGILVEALGHGSNGVIEGFYEKNLQGKSIRDEESYETLDIIFADKVFDLGFYYNIGKYRGTMSTKFKTGDVTFASFYAEQEEAAKAELKKINKLYKGLLDNE